MHEMSITQSLLDVLREHMAKDGVDRLRRVRLRVGGMTAVETDSLRFCFEVCARGTALEGAELEIEEVPLRGRCGGCGEELQMEDFLTRCPHCKGGALEMVSGWELDIVEMETMHDA